MVKRWRPYHYLWKCEKTLRQLLAWNLNDFEVALKKHSELEAKLYTELDVLVIGKCLAVSTEKLKLGLTTELKSIFFVSLMLLYWLCSYYSSNNYNTLPITFVVDEFI